MIVIGTYTVIGDAGLTLVKLLRDNLTPEPIPNTDLIGISSPADKAGYRLSLYLYSIMENEELRNMSSHQITPLPLNLYYLLTAYSSTETKSRSVDEHYILGRAMQVLYDNSTIRGSSLVGTLAERDEALKIRQNFLNADELSKIWVFPDSPYRLSVGYIVGPVYIQSTRITEVKRVMR